MTTDELKALIAAAERRYEALTPEQKAEHRAAQRRSWVRGNLMLDNPDMSFAEADRLVRETETQP